MVIKKAITMLDLWINQREEKIQELDTKFNFKDSELHTTLLENEKIIINNLKLIRKEIIPNCKHPKNMRDTCKGVKYCMDCNMDL